MPLYEYKDEATGRIVELNRPVRLRNVCPPNFKRVFSRTGRPRIGNAGLPNPAHAAQAVPRALKEMENTMTTSEIERQTGFNHKQLKRTWNIK